MLKKLRMPKLVNKKTLPWVALAVLAVMVMVNMKPARDPVAEPKVPVVKNPAPVASVSGMDI